jgi:hypothetical protein
VGSTHGWIQRREREPNGGGGGRRRREAAYTVRFGSLSFFEPIEPRSELPGGGAIVGLKLARFFWVKTNEICLLLVVTWALRGKFDP